MATIEMTDIATRPADANEIVAQIGRMNILAISGGRVQAHQGADDEGTYVDGIVLPVAHGYRVEVLLAADDTYVVRRIFRRAGRDFLHAEATNVYADQVGEVAYDISCYH